MVFRIQSVAFAGIEATPIEVQVQVSAGMPAFTIVGLADKAVAESRERVRAALSALGLSLPAKRITVNLAPADLPKEGSHLDLPIALALLASMEAAPKDEIARFFALGELSLDGRIRPVAGVLPAAITAASHTAGLICPEENGHEAMFASDAMEILAAPSLLALINHFRGLSRLNPPSMPNVLEDALYPDLADIKGQQAAKRALEISAAGGHNLLMVGPPGAGKSMLASRLGGILPPLSAREMLEVSMIQSVAGTLTGGTLSRQRPYRAPHHSSSMPALVGGGVKAKPGEITLAHKGVLFLDELAEFPRQVLDSLRQPLETRNVTVARAQAHITYPADFQLVAAMNPCRCGYLFDAARACNKAPRCGEDYMGKLSGPLLDRFDVIIEVPEVAPKDLLTGTHAPAERSATVALRVAKARAIQQARYEAAGVSVNAQADGEVLEAATKLSPESRALLIDALEKMGLSMRGHNRVLRVARTIADLAGAGDIAREHLLEALSYRHRHNLKIAA